MPATVEITDSEVQVRFHRRAHLPIVLASGLLILQWQFRGGTACGYASPPDATLGGLGLSAIGARGTSS